MGWIDDVTNNTTVLFCAHYTRLLCSVCRHTDEPKSAGNTDVVELTDLNLETRDVNLNLLKFVQMPLAIRRRNGKVLHI